MMNKDKKISDLEIKCKIYSDENKRLIRINSSFAVKNKELISENAILLDDFRRIGINKKVSLISKILRLFR